MNFKRLIVMAAALCMATAAFTGCGSDASEDSSKKETASSAAAKEESAADEKESSAETSSAADEASSKEETTTAEPAPKYTESDFQIASSNKSAHVDPTADFMGIQFKNGMTINEIVEMGFKYSGKVGLDEVVEPDYGPLYSQPLYYEEKYLNCHIELGPYNRTGADAVFGELPCNFMYIVYDGPAAGEEAEYTLPGGVHFGDDMKDVNDRLGAAYTYSMYSGADEYSLSYYQTGGDTQIGYYFDPDTFELIKVGFPI